MTNKKVRIKTKGSPPVFTISDSEQRIFFTTILKRMLKLKQNNKKGD